MKIQNSEDLFDMSYIIDENLKAVPNNYQDILKGISFLKNNLENEVNILDKGKIHSKLGFYLKIIKEFSLSELHLKKAIKIFSEEKSLINKFVSQIRLAQNLQYSSNLEQALNMFNTLENELNSNTQLENYRDFIYHHKGKVLFDLKNYSEALFYFNKTLGIRILKNDIELIESTKLAINITLSKIQR